MLVFTNSLCTFPPLFSRPVPMVRLPPPLQITAMQIASLKRLSKGTTLYIMDRNGSMAKAGESAVVSSRLY